MSLLRSGGILFAASMACNVSNYLFQFYMSRALTLQDYGALNAVFSLLVIAGIPSSTIMIVVARYTSVFKVRGENDLLGFFYQNSLMRMGLLGLFFFLPFLFFNGQIAGYLNMESGSPIIAVGVAVFFVFLVTVNLGVLQGLQRFWYLGTGIGFSGGFKLFAGVIMVSLGLGLNGAASSVALSTFLILLVTSYPLLRYMRKRMTAERNTGEIIRYGIPALVSTMGIAVLTNVDVIMVKHAFSPEEAGLYAAVSVLGKTILYLPAAFVLAIFPIVTENNELDKNSMPVLNKGLLYTISLCLVMVAAFATFPELAIKILFGNKYLTAAPLIKYYGLAMSFMAIVNILVAFNLARYRTGFVYTLVASAVLMVLLLNIFNSSLLSVIYVIMAVGSALSIVNLAMVYMGRKESLKAKEAEGVGN